MNFNYFYLLLLLSGIFFNLDDVNFMLKSQSLYVNEQAFCLSELDRKGFFELSSTRINAVGVTWIDFQCPNADIEIHTHPNGVLKFSQADEIHFRNSGLQYAGVVGRGGIVLTNLDNYWLLR